MLLKCSPIANC